MTHLLDIAGTISLILCVLSFVIVLITRRKSFTDLSVTLWALAFSCAATSAWQRHLYVISILFVLFAAAFLYKYAGSRISARPASK
jgi:hypothetical protein